MYLRSVIVTAIIMSFASSAPRCTAGDAGADDAIEITIDDEQTLCFHCNAGDAGASGAAARKESSSAGVIALSMRAAKISGPSVRYDEESGTANKWITNKDRATWNLKDCAPGSYDIVVTWHVDKESDNQAYNIDIDGRDVIRGYAHTTPADMEFERLAVGRSLLTAGEHTIVFRPSRDLKRDLAVLKSIEFIPVDDDDAVPFVAPPITAPDGFTVTVAAAAPLVQHPMLACFDDRGRLFVADAAGVNAGGEALVKDPPDVIRVLEDTNHDGVFDTSKVFADKMAFPQGILWHQGAVYVSSPPSFWRLRDTDGDDLADERTELATGFSYKRGMSDEMHGGSLGPDGMIYWAAGRFPHQIKAPNGKLIHQGSSPLIMRCRPDGADLEVFCGTVGNAVGAAFSDAGDCFVSGTFGDNETGGRDGIDHGIDGGDYPVRSGASDWKWTGGQLPVLARLGVSASSDLMVYRGATSGAEYEGNLFSALFNTHKVMRHVLEPDGATFRCVNQDFLTSTSSDFHPTDVLEAPDGSILAVDTGGWFIIGCPTSQIGKPQVRGAIYRVRKTGAAVPPDPCGDKIAWETLPPADLAELLDDDRFAVRERAVSALVQRGDATVAALERNMHKAVARGRLQTVWAAGRIGSANAQAAVRLGLQDKDAKVRQAAATVCGQRRDKEAVRRLVELAIDEVPSVRREAANALGRIGDPSAVPALLAALPAATDRFIEHAVILALIRIDDRGATLPGLASSVPAIRRGSLIALDQMDHGELTREAVASCMAIDDSLVQRTALEVIARHHGWGKEIVALASAWLNDAGLPADKQDSLHAVLLAFVNEAPIQQLIGEHLGEGHERASQLLLLDVIGHSELRKFPAGWQPSLLAALGSADDELVRGALQSAERLGPAAHNLLLQIARDTARTDDLRVQAVFALARTSDSIPDDVLQYLCRQCQGDKDAVLRLAASRAIGAATITELQLAKIADVLGNAGPLEFSGLLQAFERNPTVATGKILVSTLESAAASGALAPTEVRRVLQLYPEQIQNAAKPLLDKLSGDSASQTERLNELQNVLSGGNVEHGRAVFFSQKASCSACHRIDNQGENIGPPLSAIGDIRARRDLLEAIVFPSASFARNYEPVSIETSYGQVLSGIVSRDTNEAVYMRTVDRKETRVLKSEIVQMLPGTVSIMPQGLDKQLSADELRDLIEFLSSRHAASQAGTPR